MRNADNIANVEALGIDMMGFIFWQHSKRYVTSLPKYMPGKSVKRIGVFVDAPINEVARIAKKAQLWGVQLHGSESASYIDNLRKHPAMRGVAIIKAIGVSNHLPMPDTSAYEKNCTMLLFDTASPTRGGTGRHFAWSKLLEYHGNLPFILSGGISPDDAEALQALRHPRMIGIDLNSQFETAPAEKDVYLLKDFLNKLKPNRTTMNRINRLFEQKKNNIISLYFCAGHPSPDSATQIITTLAASGIDMIEVGIPFSDPMADGPVIQDAATKALRGGMTLRKLFEQLSNIRSLVDIPLILMGYLNPIVHYGFEDFCRDCARCGIDGMILPDLPFADYLNHYKPIADRYGLRIIMLITPETSEERIRLIDSHTEGFIYMVSSAATTGAQKSFDETKQEYFRRINAMNLRNPRMIGFGISNKQTLESAQANAAGAIIGSKFVTLLKEAEGDADKALDRLFAALAE